MARKKRPKLIVYGTRWCPQSGRVRRLLDGHEVPYRYIDIDSEPDAAAIVMDVARGNRSVPTLALPDGRYLVEPSPGEVCEVLDLPPPERRWWWPF